MNVENMRIISIDDNKTNLLIIESYAKILNLEIESFLNPKEALEASFEKEYDLVIVDYMMPEINGLEFIQSFRQNNQSTPIIMLTAVGDDMNLQIKALEYGANDFLSKPINAPAFKARIINMLKLRKSQLLLQDKALLLQDEVKLATIRLKESEYETLQMLGKTAEFKDPETNAHTQRVAYYCKLLARAYGLDENLQDIIFYASPFHDLGKIGIPDNILLKPGKLEFNFSTGKYSYTTDSGKISDDMIKIFKVNASDIDGDTTSFDVKIKVDITPNETVTTIKIPDNDTIDLTSLISNNYKNVTDVIDMTDGKINTLKIEMKDIVDLVDADKELIIKGDLGDKVDLDKPSDWSNSGKEQVDGINYNVYKGIGTNSTIKLLIDDDIDVTL